MDIKYINVAPSRISSNVGDGIFSKKDIAAKTPFALYSGQLFNKGAQKDELIAVQRKLLKEFMKTERNETKIIQYSDSINKYRCVTYFILIMATVNVNCRIENHTGSSNFITNMHFSE